MSRATEIKVRAERRCGELLRVTAENGERATQGRPAKTSNDATFSTLADMGLTRDESSRYQPAVSNCLQLSPRDESETRPVVSPTVSSPYRGGDKETGDTRQRRSDRWRLMVDTLRGAALPALPVIPGRVHRMRDEPIPAELLVGVSDPTELALLLGIPRRKAVERLAGGGGSKVWSASEETDHTDRLP